MVTHLIFHLKYTEWTTNILPASDLLSQAAQGIETSLKKHFQIQNSSVEIARRNVRKIDGPCLTESEMIQFMREDEEERKQKQSCKRKLPLDENENEKKCKKCRKTFSPDIMLLCKNGIVKNGYVKRVGKFNTKKLLRDQIFMH